MKIVGLGMLHDTDGQQATAIVQFDNLEYRSFAALPEHTFVSVPVDGGEIASMAEWVDLDQDGYLDMVQLNPWGAATIWINDLDGPPFRQPTKSSDPGWTLRGIPQSHYAAWGDYDDDGDLDLYRIAGRYAPPVVWEPGTGHLYVNLGGGRFAHMLAGSPTTGNHSTATAGWADFDNDGFLDLIGDRTSEAVSPVYRNNLPQTGNVNHWLKVQCEGRVTNRDAVGGKVRVKASIEGRERWQLRQIGRSWGGVLTAHFGLGDAAKVDVLWVEWPSWVVQEYKDVAVNQSLTIKEPPQLVPTGPTSFEVKCWPGMQFAVEASVDLKTWTGVGTVENINGTATFSDVAPAEGTCRFYRVVDD